MSAQKVGKVTKKELQAPDEFQESMGKVVNFFRLYGGWVGAGAGLIIVAIVGGVLLSRMNTSHAVDRSTTLLKALAPLAASTEKPADAEAGKKAAEDEVGRARKVLADLDKFLADNAKSELSGLAMLSKGAALMKAGDAAAAATAWKAFVDANPTSPFVWLAWESIGVAADQAGRRADAEVAFGELTKVEPALAKSYGFLHLGDMYNPTAKAGAGDPVDRSKAAEFYQKGIEALSGDVERMPGPQLVARKVLEERLQSVR